MQQGPTLQSSDSLGAESLWSLSDMEVAIVVRDDDDSTKRISLKVLRNPRKAAFELQKLFNLPEEPTYLYDRGMCITVSFCNITIQFSVVTTRHLKKCFT